MRLVVEEPAFVDRAIRPRLPSLACSDGRALDPVTFESGLIWKSMLDAVFQIRALIDCENEGITNIDKICTYSSRYDPFID